MAPHGSTLRDEQATTRSATDSLWLEIRRGRTRARRRPVRSRRFLIGAGSNCQLQLGGEEIPILHSILLINEDGAHIDAVVSTPELLVNGVPQRAADLHDGDVFSIGRFEFAVNVPNQFAASQAVVADEFPLDDADDVESMSAAELVARIEREQAWVEQQESARDQGARALLQSIARRARHLAGQRVAETVSDSVTLLRLPERDVDCHTLEAADQPGFAQRRAS
jgi:predicted component of type VI protein secretion system